MGQSFFSELRSLNQEIHQRTLNHPMVLGIGSGTLPDETFRYYIEQDFQYLRRYVQVLALATASATDLQAGRQLAGLVNSTYSIEIDALRALYERFGGTGCDLDVIERSPTCAAYTNHLLAVAGERNVFLTLAAILPCQWGYGDIGRSLKRRGLPEDTRFSAWIEEYASEEFGALVDWAIEYLNELASDAGSRETARAKDVFALSAEYEYRFWDMAWHRERW